MCTVIRGVGRETGGFARKARDRPLIRPILNDVSLRHKKPGNVIWAERAAYTTETKLLDFSKWKITNSPAYSLSDDMMAVIYMPRSLAYMLRRWTFIFIFIIRRLKLLQYTQSFGYLEDLDVECWCALLFRCAASSSNIKTVEDRPLVYLIVSNYNHFVYFVLFMNAELTIILSATDDVFTCFVDPPM